MLNKDSYIATLSSSENKSVVLVDNSKTCYLEIYFDLTTVRYLESDLFRNFLNEE